MSKQPRARDLSIRYRATTSIRGYDKNAREHSKAQQKKLKESILSFGWTTPLIIDEDGMILAGHCRYAVALELGLAEVPVVVIPDLSEGEKKGYILADNRIAEQATWNRSLLRDEFKDLLELDFDLQLTGFDTLEADRILGFDDPEPSDDNVHLPDGTPPVSRVGDLWNSGAHWLCVGDAREHGADAQQIAHHPWLEDAALRIDERDALALEPEARGQVVGVERSPGRASFELCYRGLSHRGVVGLDEAHPRYLCSRCSSPTEIAP
jgi:hypothetical protein